jgi:putative endopeptidase
MITQRKRLAIVLGLALTVLMPSALAKETATTAPEFKIPVPYAAKIQQTTPQQDFFLHVNAGWLQNTKMKPYEYIVSSFSFAEDKVYDQMKVLTQDAIKHNAKGTANTDEKNIANLYACIKDTKGREKAGLGNLAPILKRIESIQNLQEYANTMADLCKHSQIPNPLIGAFGIVNDPVENTRYIVALPGPVTKLSREQVENPNNEHLFNLKRNYTRDILHLYGRDEATATKTANDIFNLQKDLALHSPSVADKEDVFKLGRNVNLADLKKLYTHVDVEAMLNAGGVGPKNGINSWFLIDPQLTARFNELYTPDKLPLFKEYAVYSILAKFSDLLSKDYEKLETTYEKNAIGSEAEESQERRDLKKSEDLLDSVYGRLYAHKYFDESRKQEVTSYVKLIMNNYRKNLEKVDWMSPATKEKALLKLDKMDINIGYPEAWPDYYDKLEIKAPKDGGVLINNMLSALELSSQWEHSKIGTPVRKDLWASMEPQTINACYEPTDNSINFPAGILQAPFYDKKADYYTNLGGVGMVMAHEITHCFDNNGALFDELGRHRNWWTPADYAAFKNRQQNVINYYNRFVLTDGKHVNGAQTISENIADLGALSCLTQIIGHNTEGLRKAYTNFAVIWRSKFTNPVLQILMEDVHALPHARVDGVLSSTDGFYEAYDVKPGDKMYVAPEARAKLW